MDKVCRYCGKPATRWSGVDLYVFNFDKNQIINIGPQYCCNACDHDKIWIPIGTEIQYIKYKKPKRMQARSSEMLARVQHACVKKEQDSRTFANDDINDDINDEYIRTKY